MGEVSERCSPTRLLLTQEELTNMDKEQLLQNWYKQENYINWIESQLSNAQTLAPVMEEKLRHQVSTETSRRENYLLMRLNAKEQEVQELLIQIQESKSALGGNAVALRSTLLDPAVNLLIENLKKELEKAKLALEETQNELSAWKFTPDSNTGKRLMAKCRLLYQENEELGRMISCGRMAKLEGELALQRNFSEEMKKSQSELDEFLLELDEDVEGMQSTIYFLQQQLRQTRDQMATIQKENDKLRHHLDSSAEPGSNHHHRVQDSITRPTEEAVTESSSPSTRPPDQNEDDHDDVDRIRRGIVPMDVEKDDVITDVPSNQEEEEDNQEALDKNEIKVDEEEEEESPHETDLLIADDVEDVDKDVERRAEDETPKLTNTNRHSEAEEEDDDDVDKGINKKRKLENDVKSP